MSRTTKGPEAKQSLLVSSVSEIDFGTIEKGGSRSTTCRLRNPGNAQLKIGRVMTSCDCFQVLLSDDVVEPGKNVLATLKVDFSDDPDFIGCLRMEAVGEAASPSTTAFQVFVTVTVQ